MNLEEPAIGESLEPEVGFSEEFVWYVESGEEDLVLVPDHSP